MKSSTIDPVYGVVLPPSLMEKWLGVFVSVKESGASLVLESGAKGVTFNNKELNNISTKLMEVTI